MCRHMPTRLGMRCAGPSKSLHRRQTDCNRCPSPPQDGNIAHEEAADLLRGAAEDHSTRSVEDASVSGGGADSSVRGRISRLPSISTGSFRKIQDVGEASSIWGPEEQVQVRDMRLPARCL